MQNSTIPAKFPIPWANNAGSSYIVTIPTASQIPITPGAASLNDGFVPANFVNDSAGGVNPRGEDFNGILKWVTQWCQWEQAGGPVAYDATFSAQIGGYPAGAVIQSATPGGFWTSLTDNNTTDPDTGGAGWSGGLLSVGPDAGGANFRAIAGNYGVMLRNDGSNAFLLQTGSGAQAGTYNNYRPFAWSLTTGAVTIDGTGLGTTVGGTMAVTGAITAPAGTTGNQVVNFTQLATKQPLLGFVPVQQGGGISQQTNKIYLGWDGTLPRITVDSSDVGQLALQSGLVTEATARNSADGVLQTQISSEGTTRAAADTTLQTNINLCTKYTDFSFNSSGYQKLPSGMILQWGNSSCGIPTDVHFPIVFPNACLMVVVTEGAAGGSWGSFHPTVHGVNGFNASYYEGWAESWTGSAWQGGSISQNFIAVGW